MASEEEIKAQLERLGPHKTRVLYNSGNLVQHLAAAAADWLAQLDKEESERNEALKSEQMRVALRANQIAKIAAALAAAAAIIAIIAAVITYLSWKYPAHQGSLWIYSFFITNLCVVEIEWLTPFLCGAINGFHQTIGYG